MEIIEADQLGSNLKVLVKFKNLLGQ